MRLSRLIVFLFFSLYLDSSLVAQTELWGMTWRGGEQFGLIYSIPPGDSVEHYQYSFEGTYGSVPDRTRLIQASNGKLYGMTLGGGSGYGGILFEYDPVANLYIKRFDFSYFGVGRYPAGSLVEAPNGKLYGLLADGGANFFGALFEFDPVTYACVSKIDFVSSVNGAYPRGSMIVGSNGLLYGMTTDGGSYNGGTIFEYDPTSNVLVKKADLGSYPEGHTPWGDLIEASNGKFYGLCGEGGTNSDGVIFEFDPVTSTLTTLFNFFQAGLSSGKIPLGSLMQASNGNLYGMCSEGGLYNTGTLFEYNILTSTFTKKVDLVFDSAAAPRGQLMQATNGKLYGVSSYGGSAGSGAVFTYDLTTGILDHLASFTGLNGGDARGTLLQTADGKFYGITSAGGKVNEGTLFEFDTLTNSINTKVDFAYAPEGREPRGRLVKAANGKLYGLTIAGGINDVGVIFEYDQLSGAYTKKFDFSTVSGFQPVGTLLNASNGKLYGVTLNGGAFNVGTLFEFDPVTSVFTKHLDFNVTNGANPVDGLMEASNGKFYGLTASGGSIACGCGVLYEFDPATNVYVKKLDQSSSTGGSAGCIMVQAINGKLYGLAGGGISGAGTLFEYNILTNTYTKKKDFVPAATGDSPVGDLIIGADGNLYGVTFWGGAYSRGVLFKYNFTSNLLTKLQDLNPSVAANPRSGLFLSANGKMYGEGVQNGDEIYGVHYEFDPVTNVMQVKMKFLGDNGLSSIQGLIELPCISFAMSLQPVSDTTCEGQSAGFSVMTDETGCTYQWQMNSGSGFSDLSETAPYSNVDSPELLITNASGSMDTYSYQCVVTNPGGCSTVSISATLVINPAPALLISVPSDTVCYSSPPILVSTFPSGGTLTGTAMVGNYFNPANAGLGEHVITYGYIDSLGCSNSVSQMIFVDVCADVVHFDDQEISLFPNPSQGKFTLVYDRSAAVKVSLKLFNILGEQVYAAEVGPGSSRRSHEFDVSFLQAGLYLVEISAGQSVSTKRLMIN